MAGEVHGSKAELKVQNGAGVLTVVDGGSSASLQEALDTAETTAFGDEAKRYIPGLSDGTMSFEGSYTPTNIALVRGIKGMLRNFEYFPAGNSAGNEKLSGSLLVTSINRSSDVSDKVGLSVELQCSGAIAVAVV